MSQKSYEKVSKWVIPPIYPASWEVVVDHLSIGAAIFVGERGIERLAPLDSHEKVMFHWTLPQSQLGVQPLLFPIGDNLLGGRLPGGKTDTQSTKENQAGIKGSGLDSQQAL